MVGYICASFVWTTTTEAEEPTGSGVKAALSEADCGAWVVAAYLTARARKKVKRLECKGGREGEGPSDFTLALARLR